MWAAFPVCLGRSIACGVGCPKGLAHDLVALRATFFTSLGGPSLAAWMALGREMQD